MIDGYIEEFYFDIINHTKEERPLHEMDSYIKYLIKGTDFRFAELPQNDKTSVLLNSLKKHYFVSKDTKLEHFRVLFGIPLYKEETPFEPIKWRKNSQLLRFFIYTLFPHRDFNFNLHITVLFSNKHGERIRIPRSDKVRLSQDSDYNLLLELLEKLKNG